MFQKLYPSLEGRIGLGTPGKIWLRAKVHDLPQATELLWLWQEF